MAEQASKPANVKRYRFSEVVDAIGSTPKSFRRWLVTLDYRPEDGWHEFTPWQLLEFGVMRHLVDWGVSVADSATLAKDAMVVLLVGSDDFSSVKADDQAAADRLVAERGLISLSLKALALRLKSHRLYIMPGPNGERTLALETPEPRRLFRRRKASPATYAGVYGSYLTIDVGFLAYAIAERIGEDMDVPPVD